MKDQATPRTLQAQVSRRKLLDGFVLLLLLFFIF